jgi:methionyl-tRNA formyltransferase
VAEENNIPVFQPETLRDGKALEILKEINPDIIVVVAYGKILPEEILNLPKFGCVNGHASLLPKYRGASPIQWCIVCGEKVTGVTVMQMDKGMDTGDILTQEEVLIGEYETAEELFDRLAVISAELMVKTIDDIENIIPKKQNEAEATYAPIIKKEMALLDFSKPAETLFNEIRGYYSWPCAYFFLGGKRVKVITANVGGNTNQQAGTVVGNDDCLEIACGDGKTLKLLTVQPEGKGQMTAKQMLCGNKIEKGYVING